jgi:cellulose synthase/poly-beta-1,6-N-acetylglucosamine synthase-like glycosyltransferase
MHPDSMSLRPRSAFQQALVDVMFVLGIVCSLIFCWIALSQLLRGVVALSEGTGGSLGRGMLILTVSSITLAFSVRWLLLQVMVIGCYRRSFRQKLPDVTRWPYVSIMVPAHNEAPSIQATLRSLLAIDYPNFEIVVIDDGSTDNTAETARAFEGQHGPALCRVLTKPNGGKWSAHNFGLMHARGELILGVDADTTFEPNALMMMVRHMADPKVGAVAGNGIVRNLKGMITYCQALEYVYANAAFRLPQSDTGSILCVPGPIGLFRRSALDQVHAKHGDLPPGHAPGHFSGPYQHYSFAEDFDLSVALLSLGWRIVYEPRAVCHTEVPENLLGLISQRYRWSRGNMQVLSAFHRKYKPEDPERRRTLRNWMWGTYFLEMGSCFLFNYLFLALTIGLLLGPDSNITFLAEYWLINLLQRGMFSVIALLIHRERLRLLWAWPLYEFYSTLVLGGSLTIAVIDQFRGTSMGWGREHRPAG